MQRPIGSTTRHFPLDLMLPLFPVRQTRYREAPEGEKNLCGALTRKRFRMSASTSQSQPIISVSGLRGIIGESLTPDLAARYVAAYTSALPTGPLVLTRDGRTSGPMLAQAVSSAIRATGHDVLDADVAATPTTGVLIRRHQAVGGIQISASHNPRAYNGLKLFDADGRVISATAGAEVLDRYQAGTLGWVTHDAVGSTFDLDDSCSEHLKLLHKIVDVNLIRAAKFRVLLDANHGSGSLLGRALLESFECHLTLLGGEPHGKFAHPPEPTRENLAGICSQVVETKSSVGFCQDPDADRLALIDEQGHTVGEEYTLALCVDHVLSKESGPIVTNCSTSRMSQDLAQQHGVAFYRSKVGEAHVADLMIEKEAIFGGEGNGGPIDPRVGYVRDSFVGMALVLESLATRQQSIKALCERIPKYAIEKFKVSMSPDAVEPALDALAAHFSDASADRLDGLRLDWPGKWLLVRASNTEPIVRLVAECPTADEAQQICHTAADVLAGA
jgi:phosphomannomutase